MNIRRGKYTAKSTPFAHVRGWFGDKWAWFKSLTWKQKLALIVGAGLIFIVATGALTYAYYAYNISTPERLLNNQDTGIVLLDKDGEKFYSIGRANNEEIIPLSKISDQTEAALIAAEDQNFYDNPGFSVTSILGALYANVITGDPTAYGGSTLTQQLVKNTLLSTDQTIIRKYKELFLSIAITQHYSKDQILAFYLNSAYFGGDAFGIKDAADQYFGKKPADLTLAESTMLVGLLPAPNAYSPTIGDKKLAKERQKYVLDRMVEDGKISQKQMDKAYKAKLAYQPVEQADTVAPHFANMVINDLKEEYGDEEVFRRGFVVKTTLDLDWQKAAKEIVAEQAKLNASYYNGNDAAMVVQDPNTGEIRALVGTSDYSNKEFGKINMAIQPRQPGSSFKPIYYTEALNKGIITPATHFQDEPTNFNGYEPHNFNFNYYGEVTTRKALALSLNIPAVTVVRDLGVQNTLDAAERLGIDTLDRPASEYGLSIALGAGGVQLTDMVNAYSAFANEGQQFEQTLVLSVEDKYGSKVYEYEPDSKRVMGAGASFLISDILSDNQERAPLFGSSLSVSRDAAVKTGSTDNDTNAWTIGYTSEVVVGVWVGNADHSEMQAGGSTQAGPMWRRMMERAFQDEPNTGFSPTAGITERRTCESNGGLATGDGTKDTYMEFFIEGQLPDNSCEVNKPDDPDKDGVNEDDDECKDTERGVEVDDEGCEVTKDSDGDGVNDDQDECSDTTPNTEVDETGCEVESQPGNDADSDGVPAPVDECADTPADTEVDATGCPVDDTNGGDGDNNGGGPTGSLSNPVVWVSRLFWPRLI